jgi:hypothetical protein
MQQERKTIMSCNERCKFNNSGTAEANENFHILCKKGICMLCENNKESLCKEFEDKGITLQEAVDKYGDHNICYYNDIPKNALGIVVKNSFDAVFEYTFKPFWVTE